MWRGKAYLKRANPRAATHGSVAAFGFAMAKNTCDGEARGLVAWGCAQLQRGCLSYVSSVGLAARCAAFWIYPTLTQLLHASTPPGRPLLFSSSSSFFSFFSSASTFFHSHPSILSLFSSRSYRSAVLHGRFLCVLVSLRRVPLRLLHSYHYHRLVFLPLPRIQSPRFFLAGSSLVWFRFGECPYITGMID